MRLTLTSLACLIPGILVLTPSCSSGSDDAPDGRGGSIVASGGTGGGLDGAAGASTPSDGTDASGGNLGTEPEVPARFWVDETPVDRYGQLRVEGSQLLDQAGQPVQLKGVSSMWLNWESNGYAESLEGVRWLRDTWNLTVIRAAMGIDPSGAYLDNPEKAKGQVRTIVDNAIELGIYAIIDWHDHEAHLHQAEAQAFFAEMAAEYGQYPNVIYETFNEPLQVSWPEVVKPYHEAVVGTIRAVDPDNLIILGTPNWSQYVDAAANDPVAGTNLLYALHFYSCSHGGSIRSRAATALQAGIPLFVTEWGATDADGGTDGLVCLEQAQIWHDWMNANHIGWAAWKFDNCADSTCYFPASGASTAGGWSTADLHGHAPFVRDRMRE